MRVHVVNVMRPAAETPGRTLEQFTNFARRVEAHGFHGLWVTDSFGRGQATLDPIVLMSVIGAVTNRIEIGTCIMQVPVRHPVELAHRIEGLYAMTGSRLQLGVGTGSTQADFDLVGADYGRRFESLGPALDTMRQAWRGEALPGGQLTPWPGTEGGPAILLGAFRNKRWIGYAAEHCAGWIASGIKSEPEDLEAGIEFYRRAGGKRAVLANVVIDLHGNAEDILLHWRASVMLTGGEDAARKKMQWIRDLGFDDVLCLARPDSLDDLARLRDAL
ncbi:LLM class flavin-dependent oxidoreductase [Streptomyces flaveolus]|uniref:LLM class flavin-dependent oxidoreductase n=1 Tax=Streptomyces flaveolus TaxID=67297 RepID=UPI0033C1C120